MWPGRRLKSCREQFDPGLEGTEISSVGKSLKERRFLGKTSDLEEDSQNKGGEGVPKKEEKVFERKGGRVWRFTPEVSHITTHRATWG